MKIFEDPIREAVRGHLLTKTIIPISKEDIKMLLELLYIHPNTQ
jgi:uncharacterized protein Yka (UPF0111/DUF47 family)